MNKIILSLLTALSMSALLYSCSEKDDCGSICDTVFPDVTFKIVNSSGQNLTCGPNRIYTSDKTVIKSFVAGVLTDETRAYTGDSTLAGSGIIFTTSGLSTQYYLYINNVKTDSIQITYQTLVSSKECCPTYYRITQTKLNNVVVTVPFNIVK